MNDTPRERLPVPTSNQPQTGETIVNPDIPSVQAKPGYQTSQGILTALFTVVSLGLSFLGFKYSPEKVETAYQAIQTLVQIVGPLVANIPILTNYINSRGKIQSNSLWANAQLQNPLVSKDGNSPLAGLFAQQGLGGFSIDSILSAIGGGSGKKDPSTYIGLAKIIAGLAPGGDAVTKVLDKTGIGGSQGSGSQQGSGSSTTPQPQQLDPKEVEQALEAIVEAIHDLQAVALTHWNGFKGGVHAPTFADILTQIKGAPQQHLMPVTPTAQPQQAPVPAQAQTQQNQGGMFPPQTTHSDK